MLPLNFSTPLLSFASRLPVTIFDTVGGYEDGQWLESEPQAREKSITAIVLAMNVATLEFYKEGNSSVMGITLHTQAELYFADVNNSPTGQELRQSYVEYENYRFRVAGTGLMCGNAGCNLYHCVRYIL